jgi:hypothetical protein
MAGADLIPPELVKHASHEYLVYEVADHAEHAPSSIGVRLERHGSPKFSIYCTGSLVDGELTEIKTPGIKQADSNEERMMIQLFGGSPELQSFVRAWIECCYRRYEVSPDAATA